MRWSADCCCVRRCGRERGLRCVPLIDDDDDDDTCTMNAPELLAVYCLCSPENRAEALTLDRQRLRDLGRALPCYPGPPRVQAPTARFSSSLPPFLAPFAAHLFRALEDGHSAPKFDIRLSVSFRLGQTHPSTGPFSSHIPVEPWPTTPLAPTPPGPRRPTTEGDPFWLQSQRPSSTAAQTIRLVSLSSFVSSFLDTRTEIPDAFILPFLETPATGTGHRLPAFEWTRLPSPTCRHSTGWPSSRLLPRTCTLDRHTSSPKTERLSRQTLSTRRPRRRRLPRHPQRASPPALVPPAHAASGRATHAVPPSGAASRTTTRLASPAKQPARLARFSSRRTSAHAWLPAARAPAARARAVWARRTGRRAAAGPLRAESGLHRPSGPEMTMTRMRTTRMTATARSEVLAQDRGHSGWRSNRC